MDSLNDLTDEQRQEWFPRLVKDSYRKTSDATEDYNCIAWAGGDSERKWDPNDTDGRYWRTDLPRDYEVETFVKLFKLEGGYEPCENGEPEEGFEKIAIYVGLDKEVKHAARQQPSGEWTSKCGDLEDIEHALSVLEGGGYGWVKKFLKRPALKPRQN
jgi:hypothetical protein